MALADLARRRSPRRCAWAASGCRSPRRRACAWRRDAESSAVPDCATTSKPASSRRATPSRRSTESSARTTRLASPSCETVPWSGGSRAGGLGDHLEDPLDPAALQPVRAEVARLDTGDERRRSRREQDLATVLAAIREARITSSPVYPSSPSCGTPVCRPMRTWTRVSSASRGRGCGPARSGPRRVPARPPRRRRTARRRWRRPRRRCSRRSPPAVGAARRPGARVRGPDRLDELRRASTSAKRNVTVPVGSVFTPLSLGASSSRGSSCRRRAGSPP